MADQILKVRPTKIELIRLRRRLSLATRIERIIKDRLSILMMEFLQMARETVNARVDMIEQFSQAHVLFVHNTHLISLIIFLHAT